MDTSSLPWRGRLRAVVLLGLGCAVGGAAVVPYQLLMAPIDVELPLPLPLVALVAGLQTGVMCAVLGGLGWLAAERVGLKTPFLDRLAGGRDTPLPTGTTALLAAGIGALTAALVVPVDLLLLLPAMPPSKVPLPEAPVHIALMASLYGGLNEEVLTRLFVVSGLAWLLSLPARRRGERAPAWTIATAIGLGALLFGLLHLPTAAMLWELSPLVIARILALNIALAVPFGLIYWRWGLGLAMLAHFCADLVLHVLTPLFA